jgi:hypothetical protein
MLNQAEEFLACVVSGYSVLLFYELTFLLKAFSGFPRNTITFCYNMYAPCALNVEAHHGETEVALLSCKISLFSCSMQYNSRKKIVILKITMIFSGVM